MPVRISSSGGETPEEESFQRQNKSAFHSCSGQARLTFASKVGNDTDHSFDKHQLAPVMHFMFLHSENHFKTGFRCLWPARGVFDSFGEKFVGEAFEPAGPPFSRALEQFERLLLGARHFFVGPQTLHEGRKIEAHKRGPAFFTMNLILKSVCYRNVREQFAYASSFRSGPEHIFVLRQIVRNLNRVSPNDPKTIG